MRAFVYDMIHGNPVLMFPILALIIFTVVYAGVLVSALNPKNKTRLVGMAALPFGDEVPVSNTSSQSKAKRVPE